ncbi:MAG TPA: S-layer homology domain-containing protein [Symbiobacteriaceae bacterium]|nr:S-layer homology domain-containing protein [Symbiobacteriaceae bacterium]
MARRWIATAATALMLLGLYAPNARANEPATPPSTPPAAVSQPVVNEGPWVDMGPDHWAYSAAVKLKEAGVIALDPSGRFRPTDPVTRAELFKMILAARRIDAGGACTGIFADVPCTAWFAPTAETAYRLAIAEGRGEGQFDPQGKVTRQELFVALVRGLGRRWDASSLGWSEINRRIDALSDGGEVASWAQPAVAWALGQGLATPADNLFRPKAVTTRAEAAVAINRILLPADKATMVTVDGRKVFFAEARPDMVASMYAQGEPGVGGMTYTGISVRVGSIAVDPKVIPLGRLLFVEGYGYGVAADIGSAIKGNRVDLYTTDLHEAALQFGLQPRRVWVLP